MFSPTVSIRGHKCAQIFTDGNFIFVVPLQTKAQAGDALRQFIDDIGAPTKLIFDGAPEQVGKNTTFMKMVRRYEIQTHMTEPFTHNHNRADEQIRILKDRWRRTMVSKNVPKQLWDYNIIYQSEILSRMARATSDRTAYETITGDTPDISEWIDFHFFDRVWYWDKPGAEENPLIGRWLGVAHRIGTHLCYYILTIHAKVIARTTVQHFSSEDEAKPELQQRAAHFDNEITRLFSNAEPVIDNGPEGQHHQLDLQTMNDENTLLADLPTPVFSTSEGTFPTHYTDTAYDEYIGAQIMLPHNDQYVRGKVLKRLRDDNGKPIGTRHQNPMLDTREYQVQFPDGVIRALSTNTLAENLLSQVDQEGRSYAIMQEIVDHRKDGSAIAKEDAFVTSKNGNKHRKKTTRGWFINILWKDQTSSWLPLSQVKESNPHELAEYAISNNIADEPAFAWWARETLRNRNRIIAKVKKKYWRTTHKFGFELPKTVEDAFRIDQETQTDHWRLAIEKEMKKIKELGSFERWDEGSPADLRAGRKKLPGFQEITCHIIFDIKLDGKFTRKARFVAGGHLTNAPSAITYSSVVSRESVRLGFLIAALNDLEILGCDVTNAYLNAPCKEKIWFEAGQELGDEAGSVMIIRKALYGLKSSGASWHEMVTQTIHDLGFSPTKSDPDVHIRRATHPNGNPYYEMIMVYVDDLLAISHQPQLIMNRIAQVYDLKDSVKPPERYLGANICRWTLADGRTCWGISSKDYVKNAVKNLKATLEAEGTKLKTGRATDRPMPEKYRPELDTTPELNDDLSHRYLQLIGVLRWAIELGRIDIYVEVAMLSAHMALPRRGHLEAVYCIFAYLDQHEESTMVMDSRTPKLNQNAFKMHDPAVWSKFYGDVKEDIPPWFPEPLGNPVCTTTFIDADLAGNLLNRRSQTGYITFVQSAPITWFSKRQNTIESSTFGSEFVALRTAVEHLKSLRYKLRMFGVPIDGASIVLGDNESVVNASSIPTNRLIKKHQAICFHLVREAVAAGWIRVGKEPTESNIADLFTKPLSIPKRKFLLSCVFPKGGHRDVNNRTTDEAMKVKK